MIIEPRTDEKIKPRRGEIKTSAAHIGKNHVTPSGFDTEFAKIGYNHYIPSGLRAQHVVCKPHKPQLSGNSG